MCGASLGRSVPQSCDKTPVSDGRASEFGFCLESSAISLVAPLPDTQHNPNTLSYVGQANFLTATSANVL